MLVFRPPFLANFQPLMTLEQRLVAVMAADHPLAGKRTVRLRDCAAYPVALAERSIGGRQLLEEVAARSRLNFNVAAESNSFEMLRGLVLQANLISFQIRIGTPASGKRGWSRATSTTATCRAPTWCSASCARAICRSRPRSLPSSWCARSKQCEAKAARAENLWAFLRVLSTKPKRPDWLADHSVHRRPV